MCAVPATHLKSASKTFVAPFGFVANNTNVANHALKLTKNDSTNNHAPGNTPLATPTGLFHSQSTRSFPIGPLSFLKRPRSTCSFAVSRVPLPSHSSHDVASLFAARAIEVSDKRGARGDIVRIQDQKDNHHSHGDAFRPQQSSFTSSIFVVGVTAAAAVLFAVVIRR